MSGTIIFYACIDKKQLFYEINAMRANIKLWISITY